LSKQPTKTKQAKAAPPAPLIEPIDPQQSIKRRRLILLIAGLVALALSLTIYILRFDRVVGLIVDDAWYVLLAKALATGQGYTLINSPTPGIRPFYAPGFPALLSLFYRLAPDFPNNIWVFKAVSTVAMMGAGLVAFRYFQRERNLPDFVALALALATVLYPALVFLATSTVMSECVFTLVQLATILVIERGVRAGQIKRAWLWVALGGVLASYAFLTRPAALGLLAGTILYLLKERLFKQAALFALIVLLLVGPWTIYSRRYAPTPEQRAEQGANIVQTYNVQFWQRTAGRPESGTITAGELPERIGNNLGEIAKYDFGALVFYSLYRALEPGLPVRIGDEGRAISLFLTVLALIGFIAVARERMTLAEFVTPLSIGVSLLWGWEQYRLLLPLVPFLFFYMVMGVRFFAQLYQKLYEQPKPRGILIPMLIVSWFFVLTALYGNIQFINRKYDPVPEYRLRWTAAYDENEALIKYIGENVPKDTVIAAQNPALLHLYTGHKAISSDDPTGAWETWNKLGVRYLARMSPLPLPKPDAQESKYRTVHRVNGNLNLRLVDLGEPSARPVWGKN
jgi:hypothetical protein